MHVSEECEITSFACIHIFDADWFETSVIPYASPCTLSFISHSFNQCLLMPVNNESITLAFNSCIRYLKLQQYIFKVQLRMYIYGCIQYYMTHGNIHKHDVQTPTLFKVYTCIRTFKYTSQTCRRFPGAGGRGMMQQDSWEGQAESQYSADDSQHLRVGEHAVLQTAVQEVVVFL